MILLKGNIIHSPSLTNVETIENGYLLLDDEGTIVKILNLIILMEQ